MTSLSPRVRAVGLALALACATAAPLARAEPEGNQRALAEALFQAGRGLLAEGSVDDACAKLAESERLEPGGGTLLLLAICHERQGRWATAADELRTARARARRDQRADREKLADEHLAAVLPKIARLVVTGAPRGAKLVLDGTELSSVASGVPLPVDPGQRRLRVEATGFEPWEIEVRVGTTASEVKVTVPPLVRVAALPAARPVPARDRPAPGGAQRTAGWLVAGAGLVVAGVGSVLGVRAIDQSGDAKALCDPSACDKLEALTLNEDARANALAANVTIGLGAAAIAGGILLVLTAPSSEAPARLARGFRF